MPRPTGDGDAWRSAWSLGFNFAAAVAGFLFLGYAFDRYYGTSPWGVLTGSFFGLVGGMYNLIRQAFVASRKTQQQSRDRARGSGPGRS